MKSWTSHRDRSSSIGRAFQPLGELARLIISVVARTIVAGSLLVVSMAGAQTTSGTADNGTASDGQSYYSKCSGCHGPINALTQPEIKNAANSAYLIKEAIAGGMGYAFEATCDGVADNAFCQTELNDIAAYIDTVVNRATANPANKAIAHNVTTIFDIPNIYMGSFASLDHAARTDVATIGAATFSVVGSVLKATYNPDPGACGPDTVSFRVYNAAETVYTARSFTVDVADPSAPNISGSSASKTGTYNTALITYSPVSTGGAPYSYIATGLPTGLSVNSTTGQITGSPTQVGTFPVTLTARNCLGGNFAGQTSAKVISFTISRATPGVLTATINGFTTDRAFTYANPNGTATLSFTQASPVSTGAVTYASNNTSVCQVSASTLTLVGAGSCIITATRAQDANYFSTVDTIGVTVNPAAQTVTFNPQTTTVRNFANGGTFLVSPLATTTSTSGIAITYDSNTPSVCTLPGTTSTTVTIVSAGTCTIGANLAGNTNYTPAMEVPQSVTINPILPQPPVIGSGVGGNTLAVINFTPPVDTGGAGIIDYTATCTAAGQITRTATVVNSPATVTSMTNGVVYSCSVKSRNSVGNSVTASGAVNVTPTSSPVITSLNTATFTITSNGTFTITATGAPAPSITMSGTLPAGVTFSGGTGTATLSGIPAAGTAGAYPLTFTATNAGGSVMQSFTLTVQKASQSISFGALATRPMRPVGTLLSATASSGLAVSFSIDPTTTANCFLSGNLLLTINVGACGVKAAQAGNTSYNAAQTILQGFTITQGTQLIDFGAQVSQIYAPGRNFVLDPKALSVDPIDLVTDTGMTIAYQSLTPTRCSITSATVTIITAGVCTIEASQAGDANYAAPVPVSQDIAIGMAPQVISWGAQSNQTFGTGGTFAVSPLASGGGSGIPIVYGSNTPAVCTVSGSTVTKLTSGLCTLTANQGGDDNYAAAAQVTRSLTINASTPTAPTATTITPTDAQVLIAFDAPSSTGGSPITQYRAVCNPGGITATGANSPLLVTGLTNGTNYSCTVQAKNADAAGFGAASNVLMATPFLQTGANSWATVCAGCHGDTPAGVRFNAAGTTGTVLNYVRSAQAVMQITANVQALTLNELAEIAKYIETFVPANAISTPFNTPVIADVSSHLTLGTVSFDGAEVVDQPLHGTLSVFNGTQITYTPTPGYVGPDSFTYRGFRNTPVVKGDKHTVTITVGAPPPPVITSPAIASGTFGVPFAYQITATNSPISFAAAPLGGSFTINTATGLISGTPMVAGTFNSTVSATNAGGTGMQSVEVTISKANQTITFGGQAGQTFSPGGTFALNPVATVNSPLIVAYSSLTGPVCTISGTTVTMLSAGTCMIAADQAGSANYEAALQVTRSINISASVPGAPTIGTATPGDTVAAIGFTPPANNGGSIITGYTASCSPGPITGNSAASPALVSGLVNNQLYTCSVRATNAAGPGAFSSTVTVTPTATPVAPQFSSANATTFTVGTPGTFTVTATGTPAPSLAFTGTLPAGVSFTPATGVLAGTPALGTVNSYPLTFTATNASGAPMQSFALTVQKADQTISFTGPPSQPFTSSLLTLSATTNSGLPIAFAPNTPSVCTVAGTALTLLTTGTCSITASQNGNGNYNAATSVTQGFTVGQAAQTINFPAQVPAFRNFVAGSTFMISPLASASSSLAVIYSSTTTGTCSVVGLTVSMVAPGACTIATNQSGSANYLAAVQATQNVSLNATAPGAPLIGTATGGNAQATVNFTPPVSNGGSAITFYTATCNPGNISASGAASPVIVSGLANNVVHTCSVKATNGIGEGIASGTVNVTPLSGQGATLWTQVCDVCHTSVPSGNQLNGAGTTSAVINFVRANQNAMILNAAVQALSAADLADIASYIASNIPTNDIVTAVSTPVIVNVSNHITLTNQPWSAFTLVEVVSGPSHGTLGAFSGTQVQYTPTPGYMGSDSFTYRGKHPNGVVFDGDPQTVTISVNPPVPAITSATTASGIFGQAFMYQTTATNSPTSFDISGLPGGLTANSAGLIIGIPTTPGLFIVSLTAINGGGTGDATLALQIDPAAQAITFGAQTSPRVFSAGATFAIAPLANGGASANPIVYDSGTPTVCTVSATTVTMVSAGLCTITANQPGNTNYAPAPQVTQNVTFDQPAGPPGAPTLTSVLPGPGNAMLNFSPPANNGGSAIASYTGTCTAGAQVTRFASGSGSPLTVGGLTGGIAYTCSVTATNAAALTSVPSGSLQVTPGAALKSEIAPIIYFLLD